MATVCDLCQESVPADQLIALGGKNVCAGCKPDAVMNLKSGVGMAPRISPAKAEEIRRKISRLNLLSFVFALPGIGLQFLGPAVFASGVASSSTIQMVLLIRLLGIPLVIAGLVCYSLMKGRSGLFGLMGFLSCFGLIILHFIPKYCHHCRSRGSYRAKDCTACGAPM